MSKKQIPISLMKNCLGIAILTMGFSGLVAQMLLLRELLVVFSGNEFSIGIILANWLILEAFGSFFLGKRAEKTKNKIETFVRYYHSIFFILTSSSLFDTHLKEYSWYFYR
jgi:spermidine synthase